MLHDYRSNPLLDRVGLMLLLCRLVGFRYLMEWNLASGWYSLAMFLLARDPPRLLSVVSQALDWKTFRSVSDRILPCCSAQMEKNSTFWKNSEDNLSCFGLCSGILPKKNSVSWKHSNKTSSWTRSLNSSRMRVAVKSYSDRILWAVRIFWWADPS